MSYSNSVTTAATAVEMVLPGLVEPAGIHTLTVAGRRTGQPRTRGAS